MFFSCYSKVFSTTRGSLRLLELLQSTAPAYGVATGLEGFADFGDDLAEQAHAERDAYGEDEHRP